MKAILLILLLAIGGYAAWQQQTTKATIAAAELRIEQLESELKTAERELKDSEKALAKVSGSTAPVRSAADKKAPVTSTVANSTTEPAVAEVPDAESVVDKAAALTARLDEMRTIYEGHRKTFAEQEATLTRNLSIARNQYNQLRDNQPTFAEQGSRYDSFGNRIGSSGVRTSQSDREREMKKYNEQVAAAAALIAAGEAAMVKVNADVDRLERSYKEAVNKSRDEARQ
jgi:chromosome segregation ATPase